MSTDVKNSCIIFTDLDGTLLCRDSYSWEEAIPALKLLGERSVPVIFSSSKTEGEIIRYRERLNNRDPFISENGGAIFIPKGYRGFKVNFTRVEGDCWVIELGTKREVLVEALETIRNKTRFKIRGFSDMDVEEVVELTGLPEMEARLALKRYHSEPFLLEEGDPGAVLREIEGMGLRWTSGGRFYHILGQNDKGKAVHLLSEIYKDNAKDVHWVTIGVGDSLNDLPMLEAVDKAVLLKGPQGTLDQEVIRLGRSDMLYGEGGPRGWAEVLTKLILQYCPVK